MAKIRVRVGDLKKIIRESFEAMSDEAYLNVSAVADEIEEALRSVTVVDFDEIKQFDEGYTWYRMMGSAGEGHSATVVAHFSDEDVGWRNNPGDPELAELLAAILTELRDYGINVRELPAKKIAYNFSPAQKFKQDGVDVSLWLSKRPPREEGYPVEMALKFEIGVAATAPDKPVDNPSNAPMPTYKLSPQGHERSGASHKLASLSIPRKRR